LLFKYVHQGPNGTHRGENDTAMINTVIAIYHGNGIDLEETFEGRIVAIIHKATEGATIRDSKYHERCERPKELGLLRRARSPLQSLQFSV
jgi:GH25 family lysozyme M1 (1,4-beta-N-acetylmuramidase)